MIHPTVPYISREKMCVPYYSGPVCCRLQVLQPFQYCSPVLPTNCSEIDWYIHKTGLQCYCCNNKRGTITTTTAVV